MKCPECGHEFEDDDVEEIGFTDFPISLKDMRKIFHNEVNSLIQTNN